MIHIYCLEGKKPVLVRRSDFPMGERDHRSYAVEVLTIVFRPRTPDAESEPFYAAPCESGLVGYGDTKHRSILEVDCPECQVLLAAHLAAESVDPP